MIRRPPRSTLFPSTPLSLSFTAAAPRRPGPALQRLVRVLKHDLTCEPPPAPPYDLIVCRNVVIYFDRHTIRSYGGAGGGSHVRDRKSTRLNSSHSQISYAVF